MTDTFELRPGHLNGDGMTDPFEHHEQLVRLRQAGVLSQAEFEREKAHLLDGVTASAPALASRRSGRRFWGGLAALTLAAGLGAVSALGIVQDWGLQGLTSAAPSAPNPVANTPVRADISPESLRQSPPERQVQLAMHAVFGGREPIVQTRDGAVYHYRRGQLVWTPTGAVLVAPGAHAQALPATTGTLGVFYLKEEQGAFRVEGRWPQALDGAIMGDPPEWEISTAFGAAPVIVSTAGGVWQGVRCETTTLTELAASGPVNLIAFRAIYDNTGAARDGGEVASIKGAISNIVADKSFDVDFTGSRSFTQRYGRFGQRYQRLDADPTQTMPDC